MKNIIPIFMLFFPCIIIHIIYLHHIKDSKNHVGPTNIPSDFPKKVFHKGFQKRRYHSVSNPMTILVHPCRTLAVRPIRLNNKKGIKSVFKLLFVISPNLLLALNK